MAHSKKNYERLGSLKDKHTKHFTNLFTYKFSQKNYKKKKYIFHKVIIS